MEKLFLSVLITVGLVLPTYGSFVKAEEKKELSRGQKMFLRYVVPRNTIGQRARNVGKSTAAGAAMGGSSGAQGAIVGAVGGALQGTAEEAVKDVKWIFTGKNEE